MLDKRRNGRRRLDSTRRKEGSLKYCLNEHQRVFLLAFLEHQLAQSKDVLAGFTRLHVKDRDKLTQGYYTYWRTRVAVIRDWIHQFRLKTKE